MKDEKRYVSRGGLKLEHALSVFEISVRDLVVLDVGSSTGGFVDCLLQNSALKIYSVDTAYGELAWKLRNDPRVVVIERKNILFLESLPEMVDLVTIDVTFTPLEKILPIVERFLKTNGRIIALFKPQYQDSEVALKNKGVVPSEKHSEILSWFKTFCKNNGWYFLKEIESPILGGSGNKEFLVLLSK
jgi:23S rRNA (cytidine1920-2'-O)/16S rRNA (cytidine1409-2'-O)-methyltransferase